LCDRIFFVTPQVWKKSMNLTSDKNESLAAARIAFPQAVLKLDWDATWRNWVRNEKAGGNKPQQDKPGFFMGRKLSGGSHG